MRYLLLAALLLPVELSAQSNAERMMLDRYTRSHDYDLVHQRIEVRDFAWDSSSFDGVTTTTLVALRPGLDSVILDAGALLDIGKVKILPGKPTGAAAAARVEHPGDTLVIHLPRPAAFGDTVRFSIEYHGRVQDGKGLTFLEADSLPPRRPRQIWSQGEDDNNHCWFPTYDFPNDKMTWELWATVPRSFTTVSNGRLQLDRSNSDGTRTMRWAQERPSATYLVSLIVAPLVRIHDTWRGIPVDYNVYREDSALARPLFRRTPDMIEVYSRLTGVKYPWNKYDQTTVADFFGGMENVSATTLVDWLPDRRAYADRPWFWYELIAHELAHQWFGDYVTTANWANMWLNEGFATFMPGQYWRTTLGEHAGQDYYQQEYSEALDIDRGRRMPLASLGSNNIYPKGAMVLEMLRQYLGDQRFWAGIRRYLGTHALGTAVTDDLRQAFLEATGENLNWFWDEWMYQAGLPNIVASATWDSTTAAVLLTVEQTQSDTATADSTGLRFSVPQTFRMPVTLLVGSPTGDVTQRVWLEQRKQTFRIAGVRSAPSMVVFDRDNGVYKTLKFDQPTAWLAAQLQRDANLWNRWWAIGQLRSRTGDSLAAQALARAATSADYYLTRSQAAAALDSMPAAVALPALLAAAKDTSANVRVAAIEAMGTVGGSQAIEAAGAAFRGDSSYEVRAAALRSLVRLDPAHASPAIRQALTMRSYQNVIQDAGFAAAAQVGDSSFIGIADSLMRDLDTPAYLLAALGARGNQHALDLLVGHLDDARPAQRHRAQQAIEYVMPKEPALSLLRQTRESLRHPEARAELDELIDKIAAEEDPAP